MSDAEFGVFIGEEPSCKEKATHEITGEGVEEEVCVAEACGHASRDGDCLMDELLDGVRRHARDPTHAHGKDTFCDTGHLDESEVAKHSFGVRGPQRVSVLFPSDCTKLLQVGRGVRDVRNVDAQGLVVMLDASRCEADLVHSDLFDALCVVFSWSAAVASFIADRAG